MSVLWNEAIRGQYGAVLQMLERAVATCPDRLWDDRSEGTPFWHIAYHALFFCDLYLSPDLAAFQAQDFHVDQSHFLPGDYKDFGGVVATPESAYSREQLSEYVTHCRRKAGSVFDDLTEERARERCGFWWYDLQVGEFLLNNLRHTQHHVAQLALILRRQADIGLEWTGSRSLD